MKIGAIVIVNCDKDNIWYCLKGIYDACDKIVVVYSKCDWNGTLREDGTLPIIQNFEDPDKKIRLIVGEYVSQPGQRTVALDILKDEGYDYCFVVDSDEIYHPEQLQWARKVIKDNPDIDVFSVQMRNLWKTLDYVLMPDDRHLSCLYRITDELYFTKSRGTTYKTKVAKTQGMTIAERELHFIGKVLDRRIKELKGRGKSIKDRRRSIKKVRKSIEKQKETLEYIEKQEVERVGQIQTMFLDSDKIVCYHLTAVCDNRQMLRKIKTRSYKNSICPDWYRCKWLDWTYGMPNLHPTKPEQYEKAVPFDKSALPEFMKTHRFWEQQMFDIKIVKQLKVKAGVSPEERQMLYNSIRKYRPEYVVETGSGATTASFLAALKKNNTGQLISIDKPDFTDSRRAPGVGDQIRALWKDLKEYYPDWVVYEEDIREKLPLVVEELPQIDFFYHDSLHQSEHVLFEFHTVLPKLRIGSIFGMHDVTGKWREHMKEAVKAMDANPNFNCVTRYRASGLWQKIK